MADELAARALSGRVVAVLNTSSGGCDADAAKDTAAIFAEAGVAAAEVITSPAETIEEVLAEAAARADVLAVLGGDGTLRSAAASCSGLHQLLIPLPGGTMNMLPKALYGQRPWRDALRDTLADPQIHPISGGKAGDAAFFVAALLGAPTLWAEAREALRGGHLVKAATRSVTAARRSFSEPLAYRFGDSVRGKAEAVAVVCPLISKVMDEAERSLEAAAIDTVSAGEALRLGFHALFDDWRSDPSVARAKVKTVQVTGHGAVPVILDGEKVRMGRTVLIHFTPLAFRALAPASAAF